MNNKKAKNTNLCHDIRTKPVSNKENIKDAKQKSDEFDMFWEDMFWEDMFWEEICFELSVLCFKDNTNTLGPANSDIFFIDNENELANIPHIKLH
jgi:hypothetical protein